MTQSLEDILRKGLQIHCINNNKYEENTKLRKLVRILTVLLQKYSYRWTWENLKTTKEEQKAKEKQWHISLVEKTDS